MKKLSLLILLFVITLATISAQSSLEKGRKQLNAGVGFSGWGVPVYIGLDFGVSRDITLGLEASFRSYREDYNNSHYNSAIYGFSGNGNYHFNRVLNIPSNWDFYAGLNIGFYGWSSPSGYPGSGNSGLGLGAQVGGRYFFTDRFGINLEFGGGNAFSQGKFGITCIL
jgi:hypothetical protein